MIERTDEENYRLACETLGKEISFQEGCLRVLNLPVPARPAEQNIVWLRSALQAHSEKLQASIEAAVGQPSPSKPATESPESPATSKDEPRKLNITQQCLAAKARKTASLAIASVCVALAAFGQVPSTAEKSGLHTTALNGGTNFIAGGSTTNYSITQPVDSFESVGVVLSAKGTDAGASGALTMLIARSLDGIYYESSPSISVPLTLSGTAAVTVVSSIAVPTDGKLKIVSIQNEDANAVTNVLVSWLLKPQKRAAIPTASMTDYVR